ncbi:hypothetical protein DPMN_110723 [Dreissena polymorpha]|uniref:Uncharacterized protein n=1 Tax=Dreissena polymorpha TaxID=45954 RepID=A0A9D4KCJ2_DREPO|nr:hypothetical protein DPMN_110723 [Dreissena polymorpha]
MAFFSRSSPVLVPSLDRVAPWNFKLVTSCSFTPLMLMSTPVLFVLFSMIFDFSFLYAPALS